MLQSLSIRDVVLITRLDLSFGGGLCVLTGETGAGKSILLDSLGLALGMRAEARLVRSGAERAQVTATFDLPADRAFRERLTEQGIPLDDGVVMLKRLLGTDGRSRAFINDEPVSVGLLRDVGDALVEIHGQFESQRLTDPKNHRDLLDAFGGLGTARVRCAQAHAAWRAAHKAVRAAREALETARRDEDFMRHAVEELDALAPMAGEDAELSSRRGLLQASEKLIEAVSEATKAVSDGRGIENALTQALVHLERAAPRAEGRFEVVIGAFNRALAEVGDALGELDRLSSDMDMDPGELNAIEERLFALRALARKHNVEPDKLAGLLESFRDQLQSVDDGGARLARLEAEAAKARDAYTVAAGQLTEHRRAAAGRLDRGVTAELAPLKLDRARFVTAVQASERESDWGADGWDAVAFEVATNPGSAPGPIGKIASGGELSRFMLALKAVLAAADSVPTLIFDEVDAGIGGATAAAVGERLAKLGADVQVLVVTHSPQVAARGSHHLRIAKREEAGSMVTLAEPLDRDQREGEIARMLAGDRITDEARAAARSLISAGRDAAA